MPLTAFILLHELMNTQQRGTPSPLALPAAPSLGGAVAGAALGLAEPQDDTRNSANPKLTGA